MPRRSQWKASRKKTKRYVRKAALEGAALLAVPAASLDLEEFDKEDPAREQEHEDE